MQARSSGVLLHLSSLPSAYGVGDMGPEAYDFARLLARSGQKAWQILPLNPTSPGIGNSPYSCLSAYAGNSLFISPELLLEEGFIDRAMLDAACAEANFNPEDFLGRPSAYKEAENFRRVLLQKAFDKNREQAAFDNGFRSFCAANHEWLDDYARFVTIKEAYCGASWTSWPQGLSKRAAETLSHWDSREELALQRERFIQYLFYRQWKRLHAACAKLGLSIVGDLPIYLTHDSAEVWANPENFLLEEDGKPHVVAGVPPDYFSPNGQRWGNPLYDWKSMAEDGFSWWTRRLAHNLALFDSLRLDHFRGFAAYWEVPAEEKTAINGRWMQGPGLALFNTLTERIGKLPIIAEDLGLITDDVRDMQKATGFPGMAVLQFGFSGNLNENPHTPFRHTENQIVYPGTHDNAPTRGWFMEQASTEEKRKLATYLDKESDEAEISRHFIRLSLSSVARMAIIPAQDILDLGMESRMNTPSTVENNWTWRLQPNQLNDSSMAWLTEMTAFFGRWNPVQRNV